MDREPTRRGVSKAEWFDAALDALAEGGVNAVTVEGLAVRLGIARSGFYWHFKSRQALLDELLNYWSRDATGMFRTAAGEGSGDYRLRLLTATKCLHDDEHSRREAAVQQWARQDAKVASVVAEVNHLRLEHFYQALDEAGISGDDADMRAFLFICSIAMRPRLVGDDARIQNPALIKSRIEFLTQ